MLITKVTAYIMKIKTVLLLFVVFSQTALYSNENILKYLIFRPQNMEVAGDKIALESDQFHVLETFLIKSLQEGSAGKWELKTPKGTVDILLYLEIHPEEQDDFRFTCGWNQIEN